MSFQYLLWFVSVSVECHEIRTSETRFSAGDRRICEVIKPSQRSLWGYNHIGRGCLEWDNRDTKLWKAQWTVLIKNLSVQLKRSRPTDERSATADRMSKMFFRLEPFMNDATPDGHFKHCQMLLIIVVCFHLYCSLSVVDLNFKISTGSKQVGVSARWPLDLRKNYSALWMPHTHCHHKEPPALP